ncbi:RNA-directed DNA polymerase, eukaryota, reverse transcriptase zinc-binding domain protein [Tanacetum coccineum]
MASNNRSSRRQKRIPSKFADHVMENQSQKKNDKGAQNDTEEIRVEKDGLNNGDGENGVIEELGVFGNMDKDHNIGKYSDATDVGSDSLPDHVFGLENMNENVDVRKEVDNKDNEKVNDTIPKNTKSESYVNMVKKDEIPKKLCYKPTELNDHGVEVVIFDEMIVKKGCEKWNLTVSGYFVGYKMAPNELRYNIRRMWGKYGVRDIRVNNDGTCLFKFNNLEGLQTVIDKGPWMVNNRPLIVQKWNPDIGMQKAEHCKLPIWVKLTDVPLEAWSTDGISALASSLGNPLIMDAMTASMCHNGMGRIDFARVLVEMDASKEFKSVIEVQYRDNENKIKGTKKVNVSYDWKPAACSHCKVFGHDYIGCTKRNKTPEEVEMEKARMDEQMKKKNMENNENGMYKRERNYGYTQNNVRDNGKLNNEKADTYKNNRYGWNGVENRRQEYRKKQVETFDQGKEKSEGNHNAGRKQWPLKSKEFREMKRSANKYSILETLPEDDPMKIRILKDRIIVDQYITKKIQPSVQEIKNWSQDMIKYFKGKWKKDEENVEEDIVEEVGELERNVIANEIAGRRSNVLNQS